MRNRPEAAPVPTRRLASVWLALALAAALACPAATAQDGEPTADIDFRDLGNAYAHLISFAAEPQISASRFRIDSDGQFDQEMEVLRLPLYREFTLEGRRWKWFAQAAFSAMSYSEEGDLDLGPLLSSSAEATWRARTGLVEAGLVLPLGAGWEFTPGIGAGATRLENKAEFSNPLLSELLGATADGRLYNWETSATIARAHLGMRYRRKFGTLKVNGSVHYVYSNVNSFNEAGAFSPFDAHNGSVSVKLDLAQALPLVIGEHPLYLVGHVAATSFVGAPRNDLGFSHFYELGVALGYRQLAVGVQAVLGDDVEGLTLTLDYGF